MLARVCQTIAQHQPSSGRFRILSTTRTLLEKPLPPRRAVDDSEVAESFLKGSGPGGQKINKTNSAVQLKHLPTGIVVKCQETRSREQNRTLARRILGEKLDEIEKGDDSRNALKAERTRKKKASADKKARRKYRKLEDGKSDSDRNHQHDEKSLSNAENGNTDQQRGTVTP